MDTQSSSDQVLYLYGVIPHDQPLPTSQSVALEAVTLSGLVALVEPVSASEFSPQVLEEKLQHVGWVSALARRHTGVLEDIMQHGPVVPARLCTLFSSAHALRDTLAQSEQEFQLKLEQFRGRQEWGLKVFSNTETLRASIVLRTPQLKEMEAEAAKVSPGQGYVLRKKREALLTELVSTRLDEAADVLISCLAATTADISLRPLLSEAASGRSETMALNLALLADVERRQQMQMLVTELAGLFSAEGFSLELTGPWPPYSFCDSEEPEP